MKQSIGTNKERCEHAGKPASPLEKVRDEFSSDQISLIEEGRKSFHAGKGTDWRKVKGGKV